MERLYNTRLMDVTVYKLVQDRNRARIAYITTLSLGVLFTLYGLLVPFRTPQNFDYHTYAYRALRPVEFPLYTLAFFSFYVLLVATLVGVRLGYLRYVALLPAAMIYVGGVSIAVQSNIAHAQNAFLLIIALIVAGLLDGERGLFIFMPLHFLVLTSAFILTFNSEIVHTLPTNTVPALVLLLLTSGTIIGLLFLYQRTLRTDQTENQMLVTERRLQLARLTSNITRKLSRMSGLDEVVEDILADFPIMYHVQVFLTDSATARLVASTGDVGDQLLARNHNLPIGSLSVIGQVTQRQETIVAVVGREDSVHRPNDLLPNTRLEVALPLVADGRIIGALDLQSRDVRTINENDLTILRAVADTIAVALHNLRLAEQNEQFQEQNQVLEQDVLAARQEVNRLNRELTGSMWADYLRGQHQNVNLDINFEDGTLQAADDLTETITDAINRQEIVRYAQDGKQIVAVPLRVRGEVVGALEFEVDQELSGEDINMLDEVAERLGLAAENNRLYQDSQRIAQREALVNEIGNRIQSATSVEATLTEAAHSLRDALRAQRIAIQLGSPAKGKENAPR